MASYSNTRARRRLGPSLLLILAGIAAIHLAPSSAVAAEPLSNLQQRDSALHSHVKPWANQVRSVPLPTKRHYDTHHYYVVELSSQGSDHIDPVHVAETLGAEYVERAGELKNHYLFRFEKPFAPADAQASLSKRDPSAATKSRLASSKAKRAEFAEHEDPVLKRWAHIKRSRSQPGFTTSSQLTKRQADAAFAIKAVERQTLRRRHKRDKIYDPVHMPSLYPQLRSPLPGPDPQPYPEPGPRPPPVPTSLSAQMMSQFGISDPIFAEQWHLANDKKSGFDLNVTGVWSQNITGTGVNVALIDDGLDMHSPDLADNFFAAGSYDFNAHTELPEPRESDDQHGTRCAGEIAALKNDVCGVGVAHNAHVAGVRILSGPISDVDEAAALNYAYQDNHVYSCSWGPPDDGRSMDAPKGLIAKAMLNGVQNGRGGKGSIFVFAGGNGGASDDQCNFDGYTNSIFSMTIAAVDRMGQHPYYSEMCAANIATGWSSGSGDHIHTTDVAWNGVNRCTAHHGGTSAAAPLVAGVVALALQVRPDLTWRDVQHVAVRSAIMVNPEDKDWQLTQAGRHYNHKYGYGVIDAYQFLEEAKQHKLVTPQAWYESPNITLPATETLITDTGTSSSFTITQDMLNGANLASLEHITVQVWITHQRRGDVNVELTSPHGTKSVLARSRRYDDATTGFPGWSFMTLKHWDESPIGEWNLRVFDPAHPDKTGNFWAWSLTLWGASADPLKAVPWNFPEDSVEYHETLAAAPTTTTVYLPSQLSKPTDHLPSDHGVAPGESHVDFTNTTPSPDTGYISLHRGSTVVVIALGIVVIFAASLAAFFIMRRRRAARMGASSAEYEFVPEDEEGTIPMRRVRGEGRTKELYDAFAENESDDEAEGGAGGGAGTGRPYRDDEDERFVLDDEKTRDDDDDAADESASGSGSWQDAGKE